MTEPCWFWEPDSRVTPPFSKGWGASQPLTEKQRNRLRTFVLVKYNVILFLPNKSHINGLALSHPFPKQSSRGPNHARLSVLPVRKSFHQGKWNLRWKPPPPPMDWVWTTLLLTITRWVVVETPAATQAFIISLVVQSDRAGMCSYHARTPSSTQDNGLSIWDSHL